MDDISYHPIGILHCDQKQASSSPQQAIHSKNTNGQIQLSSGQNFEQALDSLSGFSHIWILFHFHHNTSWKTMVQPPRGSPQKRGVFATRSPYRPNGIGMSVVELLNIEGLKLNIGPHDLLDGTPILDLKPYLSYADSFPEATLGWTENIEPQKYELILNETTEAQLQFLETSNEKQLRAGLYSQLQFDPINSKVKRVQLQTDQTAILAFRTWRAAFTFDSKNLKVWVLRIFSGYSDLELMDKSDPYMDKELHRQFVTIFQKGN